MRRYFTVQELQERGLSRAAIRWGERCGRWRLVYKGVYGLGPHAPTAFDRAAGTMLIAAGVAGGSMAGFIHGLDSIEFAGPDFSVGPGRGNRRPGVRRRHLPPERIVRVRGLRCVDGLQTLVDLAAMVSDLVWEHALESALRKKLTTIEAVERASCTRVRGVTRMRRVLGLRPTGAAPTESLLETLAVQLARTIPGLPDPVRQYHVFDDHGRFVARVDLAWPELGIFIELDGQRHKGQPVYDASRETAVVAATGWLCGRFTWTEVRYHSAATARRLGAIVAQARRRPMITVVGRTD